MTRKTRDVVDESDFTCPMHGTTVEQTQRWNRDEDGKSTYGGEYLKCPQYRECRYYVSGDMRVPMPQED